MTAIKLKSKDGLVRADFFKASIFCRRHKNKIGNMDYMLQCFLSQGFLFQHLSNPTRYVCKLVKTFGGVLMMGGGKLIK